MPWWEAVRQRFAQRTMRVITRDTEPETQRRRSQFLQRMVAFVRPDGSTVRLAYYPREHRTYTPIEPCGGMREQHGNGALRDTGDAVRNFTARMTGKRMHPVGDLVTMIEHTGVRLSPAAMAEIEAPIVRLPGLEKWFVAITPSGRWDD